MKVKCVTCNGHGKIWKNGVKCPRCHGAGELESPVITESLVREKSGILALIRRLVDG